MNRNLHITSVKLFIFFSIFVVYTSPLLCQISGKISSQNGEPLGFASVFIKGTTKGTSSNSNGIYIFNPDPGNLTIGFHYIGYQPYFKTLNYDGNPIEIDVILSEEVYELPSLDIRADAEDPAYAIIRNAIAKRPIYKASIESFKCDVYIKSIIRLEDAPQSFMGQSIDNLEGWLDEDRKGIMYLSESQNQYFFKAPNQRKEIMISSKVSGNDNGFSFNRFGFVDFYDKSINIGRQIVNPITEQAFSYYRFKLVNSYYNDEGININKIEVIPRRSEDPVFNGFIYIIDQSWLIHSVDFFLTKNNSKIDLIDTIFVHQLYLPTEKNYYPLFQQNLLFSGNFFGFKFKGEILAVSSNYEINKEFEANFFNREIVKIEPLANKKTAEFWNEIRPVPLTDDEIIDYVKKDSLSVLRESKEYLDSLDKIANRFKTSNLFLGYTYRNAYKNYQFSAGPDTDWFNAIQGWTLGLKTSYLKTYKEQDDRSWKLSGNSTYGFADKRIRWKTQMEYKDGKLNRRNYFLSVGNQVLDINSTNTLSRFFNAYLMVLYKNSISRFYESNFANVSYNQIVGIGHIFKVSAHAENRFVLQNMSEYSYFKKERQYSSNNDFKNEAFQDLMFNNNTLRIQSSFDWRPGMRYISYPDQRYYSRSKYPTFRFGHISGIVSSDEQTDFHMSYLQIFKRDIWNTIAGNMSFNTEVGLFWKKPISLLDYKHFIGGESTWVDESNYLQGFQLLEIYAHSTNDRYFRANLEWNDQSFLFDKIPGINKLGLSLVYGASTLHTPTLKLYQELYIGIDRLGYKLFRFFRINVVANFVEGQYGRIGFTASTLVKL